MKRAKLKFIAILLATLLAACSGKKSNKPEVVSDAQKKQIILDPHAMFDGVSLNGWEPTKFGTEGPVYVSDGKIVIVYGDGASGITWTKTFPKVNYEVALEARKTAGNDFFCGLTFPVNSEFCSLIIGGWGGPVVGLSCIDGLDAEENETNFLKRFDKNIWYKIKLKVDTQYITAWIDNEKVVELNYPGRELYVRPEVELSKPFGICTWITSAEIKNIKLNTF